MVAVVEAEVRQALTSAENALQTDDFAAAHKALIRIANRSEAVPLLALVHYAARHRIDANKTSMNPADLHSVESFVSTLDRFDGPIPTAELSAVRSQIVQDTAQRIKASKVASDVNNPAAARVFFVALRASAPKLYPLLIEQLKGVWHGYSRAKFVLKSTKPGRSVGG